MKTFTKVLDSMAQLGAALPDFKTYAHVFAQDEPIQRVLGLFFRDILDFHSTALKFFRLKRMHVKKCRCQDIAKSATQIGEYSLNLSGQNTRGNFK